MSSLFVIQYVNKMKKFYCYGRRKKEIREVISILMTSFRSPERPHVKENLDDLDLVD